MTLSGSRIILGITGGIAAYKAPQILRDLQRRGSDVRVVMTENAHRFVAPMPLEVLSRHPVHTSMFASDADFPVLHVGLAAWADTVLIAPATANLVAKMAHGLADDLLSCLLLGTTAPVLLAPSMEEHMLESVATRDNLETLRQRGCHIIEPTAGELASGASGRGRLPEPQELVAAVDAHYASRRDLQGLRLLITAGPTFEDVDPVRFIGNRSSGKMGYALARRAQARGASVCLISGPTALPAPAGVELQTVRSTCDMQRAVDAAFPPIDVAIMAAAPSDFRPRSVATEKIKREAATLTLELVANPDIAAGLGARKIGTQQLIVFALETASGQENARAKLARKGADLVVLNSLRDEGAGFEVDTNVVTLIDTAGQTTRLPRMSKDAVADEILDWVRTQRAGVGGGDADGADRGARDGGGDAHGADRGARDGDGHGDGDSDGATVAGSSEEPS
jgi:phosphopantothenoylcysteine decarboxylase / phosphopantothenate---cysteine ligase